MPHILLIDDDIELCESILSFLQQKYFKVSYVLSATEAFTFIQDESVDLILLDIMLPDSDGFVICREISVRAEKYGVIPIIMISARDSVFDRIIGLESGADDYLSKPFNPYELLARIQSVLRRSKVEVNNDKNANMDINNDLIYFSQKRQYQLKGELLDLTESESELLLLFASKTGEVITRNEIIVGSKNINENVYDRAVDSVVSRLRGKLKDPRKSSKYIQTVWGGGYKFVGSLQIVDE